MELDARRDEGARREVAGRLPRRGAARPDEERARHAAGSEAEVGAGARRRVRARGRRLRFDSTRCTTAVRTDLEEHAKRDADAQVRQQLLDEIVAGEPVRRAAELGEPDDRRLHAGVPDSGGAARAVRRASSRPVAERQVRRDMLIDAIAEQREARGDREGRRRARREGRRAARRRSGPGVRVAAEGGATAGDRAQHHGREGVRVADRPERSHQRYQR